MIYIVKLCTLLTFLTLSWPSHAQQLLALVDRNQVAIDETLQLTVRYSGNRQVGQPDFSLLEKQFDILSTSKTNKFSNINGIAESYTDWIMLLAPKREGKLLIPSFRFDGLISDALEITVTPVRAAPQGKLRDVFLETVVSKDSVYVQEQLLVTYRLYYAVNVDSLDREELKLDNIVKQELPDVRYTRTIDGRLYGIAEFSYALFPQTSGDMTIPALAWDIKIPKASDRSRSFFGFTGRYEISRLRTDEKIIGVRARPAAFPADKSWLPASDLQIEEKWSDLPETMTVGEPITSTITLSAQGLMASQLTRIWQGSTADGLKIYADQPKLEDEAKAQGMSSRRVESAAVVAAANGEVQLPEIRIPWWDVDSDSLRYAELPARILMAAGGSESSDMRSALSQGAGASAANSDLPLAAEEYQELQTRLVLWQGISAGLLLAMLSTFGYLWAQRNRKSKSAPRTSELKQKQAFIALQRACATNEAQSIRQALLAWARIYWPTSAINTLEEIGMRINSPELTRELRAIDRALYASDGGQGADGNKVLAQIKAYLDKKRAHTKEALAPFYAS